MYAQRVQLKTTIAGQQVPLNPYTDCVKNVRQQMPLAGSKLLGTTVLYVGPTTDTYSTGVCYTCKATESSSYYWEAVAAGSSGATNITVNGISPDADGNIQLKAENISFSSKNSMGEDFPCSASIDRQNLQTFFESIQYAIFSVNGYSAYFDSDNDRLIGDISIYGNTMYLTEDATSPGNDWDGNTLNTKTIYELASDVYSYCPKGLVINDGQMATTDSEGVLYLRIGAENVIVREEWSDYIQEYNKTYLTDTLSEINYLKMGVPYYYQLEDFMASNTDHYAEKSGWIIVNARSDSSMANPIKVIIDGSSITKMSCATEYWQTVVVPVMEGMTWHVEVPGYGAEWVDWEIKFLPCTPLYNI